MLLNSSPSPLARLTRSSGQALVEFTLTFLILLVVAWIPADFGLAFYSGQIAQNAAREGARIAAADSTLVSGTTNRDAFLFRKHLWETAARLSLPATSAATITLDLEPDIRTNCSRMVTVTVSGTCSFFLPAPARGWGSANLDDTPIVRQTRMRWEGPGGMLTS
jgi:Flp pilus assembly protein TadG